MSYAYEICPKCGGVKWIQMPDWDRRDSTTDSTSLKECTCPPKLKKKEVQTLICPHCKGIIQVL